jgi:hypothetical protein
MAPLPDIPDSLDKPDRRRVHVANAHPSGRLAESYGSVTGGIPGRTPLLALVALVLIGWIVACGNVSAQEKPQKGVDASTRESRAQMRNDNDQQRWLVVDRAQAEKALRRRAMLTPQESTQLFLESDVNGDGVLTRSEVPAVLATLRASFGRYDRDQDHRLTYSEFCNYVDAMPESLVALISARGGH